MPVLNKCEKCCFHAGVFQIYLLNIVDFCIGCALISFSVYLLAQLHGDILNSSVAWLVWCCLILGILCLLIVLCSFCALANVSCRWAMRPSVFLSGLAALFHLILGIMALALRKVFKSYLDDHGSDLGLSDRDMDLINTWYIVIDIFFFASVILQILRIWMAQGFVETAGVIDGEYTQALTREEEQWESDFDRKKASTHKKYQNLRQYYKNRFAKDDDNNDQV